MNLPNRLSLTRVLLVPVIVILLSLDADVCRYLAAAVFLLGSLTDYFDGQIARKRHLITDFGRFIDPLADKLLVLSTLIMLSVRGLVPGALTVLILARELAVDGLRMIVSGKGTVIAAAKAGKIKTASQMVYILLMLLLNLPALSHPVLLVLTLWIAVITLYSGYEYFRDYGKALLEDAGRKEEHS